MTTVRRIDVTRFDARKAKKLDNGFLRAPAQISRIGIYEYLDSDGKVRRELRTPKEVFDQASLDSFAMMPVTDGHPGEGFVDDKNARQYQRGQMGETLQPAPDGVHVAGTMMITDGVLVRKVEDGTATETSCGYTCDALDQPGEVDDKLLAAYPALQPWAGQRYDVIQTCIRGNHVAVLPRGRAGPGARVKLDSGDAIVITDSREVRDVHPQEATVKITIRGITFDVPDQAAEALLAERQDNQDALADAGERITALQTELTSTKTEVTKQTARADAAEAQVKTEKQRADAASDKKTVLVLVKDSLALVDAAHRAGLEAVKLDESFDALSVKRLIAEKVNGIKLDGKDATYVEASYDIAKTKLDEHVTGTRLGGTATEHEDREDGGDGEGADARQDMIDEQNGRWKKPIPGAVKA